jgi:thiamine-monophosphate kinase
VFLNSSRSHECAIIFFMKVSELGEFGLIDLLARTIADSKSYRPSPDLTIGIGDDAAAWRSDAPIQLATIDSMIQDIHFSLETATWPELGWKSLAINLSDIAAMGGVPRYALVALALPEDTAVEDVAAFYEGMLELAGQSRVAIAGGNISRSPVISITVTVLGHSYNHDLLRRDTARPGDIIAVTGHTGSAAAGMEMLRGKMKFKPEVTKYLRDAFLRPAPRLAEGQLLVKHGIATAIDTSDGLLADLRHICQASRVSARIEVSRLPVHAAVADNFGERARELALSGGEDYELLFTGSTAAVASVKTGMSCPVTVIGEITESEPGEISLFDADGNPVKINMVGWTHF